MPYTIEVMHLSMSSRRGGRQGIGRDFDIFPKIAVKFPTPAQKCEVKCNWNSPPKEVICGHGEEQKFKYRYSRDRKIIQMPYPRAKAIDQIPALCPPSPSLLFFVPIGLVSTLICKYIYGFWNQRKAWPLNVVLFVWAIISYKAAPGFFSVASSASTVVITRGLAPSPHWAWKKLVKQWKRMFKLV